MSNDWPCCVQCGGIRIRGRDSCLAHAKPEDRAAVLKQFSGSGQLDVRGVTIPDALFKEIFDAAPRRANNQLTFSAVQFDGATFRDDAGFEGVTFEDYASFDGAVFKGCASFDGATFKSYAVFDGVTFTGNAVFEGATFTGNAVFEGATFTGNAGFDRVTFTGSAGFDRATFKDDAWFEWTAFKDEAAFSRVTFEGAARFDRAIFHASVAFGGAIFAAYAGFGGTMVGGYAGFGGATFEGSTWFSEATFKNEAWFSEATFKDEAWFSETTFNGDAWFGAAIFKNDVWFGGSTFKGDAGFSGTNFKRFARFGGSRFEGDVPVLGPIVAEDLLDLDGVHFTSVVRIEADAGVLTCRRGRFSGGVRFDVRRAVVRLDDSDLSAPSLLTGPPVSSPDAVTERPKLISLQGANVAGLALGNVSLIDCRFAGAHNLDKLRLEADAVFGLSPAMAGWERRQIIAEEMTWRAARGRPGRWKPPPWPDRRDQPVQLSPGSVANLYRALRKSREDAKDEPGAADFYYGEMEMRRHDRGAGDAGKWRGRASRIVLTAYCLISGYSQRAWRSFAALAAVTAMFALAFHYVGFFQPPKPAGYWTSLLYAFRSTISLTDNQVTLTAWGSFFQALLRITGPVLLSLTLLALRNRVKR